MYTPKFTITNQILKNIGVIEACKEVIENSPLVPYYEKQFKSEALLRRVHHGTHIEGVELSFDETKKILEGEDVVAYERDVQQIINYRNVMRLLDDLASKRGGYDMEMLLEIHKETVNKIVPPEKAGVLRNTGVVVKNEETQEIIFQPPSFIEVPFILEDFFNWLNSKEAMEIHPILRAGIAHYILVSVHPFVEGNGRTARAFSNLIMIREGYDIKRFFALEEHFDSDPESYYQALSQVDRQSKILVDRDLTAWLAYFTWVVAFELSKIKEKVRKLSIDAKLKGKIGEQVTLSERQMKIIEFISENGSAIMQELKNVLPMVSEDTILRDLGYLMNKGIVKKEGKTKAARYIINK